MELQTDNRRLLRDYLLGRLDEAGREQAEHYFEDPALFDELIEVENDLCDQYARGHLPADERAAFARYLTRSLDARSSLAFARALAEAAVEREEPLAATTPSPDSWRQRWLALMRLPAARPQFAAAVALILLLAGSTLWLLAERGRLRSETQAQLSEQEALRQRVESLEQRLTTQETRATQLQGELDQAEQRSAEQVQEIARLRSQPSPIASLVFPLLSLLKGGSAAKSPTLVIKPHTQLVSLTVPLGGSEEYSSYGAVLQTREGERVWEQERKPLRTTVKSLVFRLPAGQFASADYTLTVILTSTRDNLELPFSYHFTVVKE
jgi:cell division protein FtsB